VVFQEEIGQKAAEYSEKISKPPRPVAAHAGKIFNFDAFIALIFQ